MFIETVSENPVALRRSEMFRSYGAFEENERSRLYKHFVPTGLFRGYLTQINSPAQLFLFCCRFRFDRQPSDRDAAGTRDIANAQRS